MHAHKCSVLCPRKCWNWGFWKVEIHLVFETNSPVETDAYETLGCPPLTLEIMALSYLCCVPPVCQAEVKQVPPRESFRV